MSSDPYQHLTGLGHGANWGSRFPHDPDSSSSWPPPFESGMQSSNSTRSGASSGGALSISRSLFPEGNRSSSGMSGDAATFRPGQNSHYYHDLRGEWQDDDF
jgi:hypothetical protein